MDDGAATDTVSSSLHPPPSDLVCDDEDDEEEEMEPRLKYERLSSDLRSILSDDSASCIAIHPKVREYNQPRSSRVTSPRSKGPISRLFSDIFITFYSNSFIYRVTLSISQLGSVESFLDT